MTSGDGMRVTVCLGGSVIAPTVPDVGRIRSAAAVIRKLKTLGHEVLVVVGGGKPSREFIAAARELGADSDACDLVGIDVTRLNARLLIASLGGIAGQEPAKTYGAALRELKRGKVPVMGGTGPSHTTDAVAATLAKVSKSNILIFFADVGGIYTADPKVDPEARKLDLITGRELVELVSRVKVEPGMKAIIDPIGARVIERSRIPTLVLGFEELKGLPTILKGGSHGGTVIVS